MIPEINHILFYFSTLFTLNTLIISERSSISLDLVSMQGRIEYLDLTIHSNELDLAEAAVKTITQQRDFDDFLPFMLDTLTLYKKRNKLNAIVAFSYHDQDELFNHLYFSFQPQGHLIFPVLEYEKLISSNGKRIKEDELMLIQWDAEISDIVLTLSRNQAGNKKFGDRVSLLEYWENVTSP